MIVVTHSRGALAPFCAAVILVAVLPLLASRAQAQDDKLAAAILLESSRPCCPKEGARSS